MLAGSEGMEGCHNSPGEQGIVLGNRAVGDYSHLLAEN